MKKEEILILLRERNDFVSGQELCEKFGVSRTAVWKVINQLKEEGYEISSVHNKGYCLVAQKDVLSDVEIKSRLQTERMAWELVYLTETGSTNNDCKLMAEQGAKEGLLVVADRQNSGKGRRGRSWQSPKGTTISMSLLLRPTYETDAAPQVTLVMALAMADAVREVTGLEAKIKWPNDIVVGGKKICGILTEMSLDMDTINYVVIGVGVNVNNDSFEDEIQETATSLKLQTGNTVSRASLIAVAMKYFEQYYEQFSKDLDMKNLKDRYQGYLVSMGKEVRVLDPKGEYVGVCRGINEAGELMVELQDGTVTCVYAGEVSVRGLYGYT